MPSATVTPMPMTNLYDVDAKYDDVVSLEETLEYLEEVNAIRTQ